MLHLHFLSQLSDNIHIIQHKLYICSVCLPDSEVIQPTTTKCVWVSIFASICAKPDICVPGPTVAICQMGSLQDSIIVYLETKMKMNESCLFCNLHFALFLVRPYNMSYYASSNLHILIPVTILQSATHSLVLPAVMRPSQNIEKRKKQNKLDRHE